MLRNILLALGATMIAVGFIALLGGSLAAPLIAMIWGAVLVFGILYERYVYKTVVDKPPAGKYWARTTERFVDDKTGKTLTVYYNTLSGERAYVAE